MTRLRLGGWDGAVGLVAVLIVANKGVSYLREQGLARVFGATPSFDAYAIAIAVSSLLFGAVGSAVAAVTVPAMKSAGVEGPAARREAMATTFYLAAFLLLFAALCQAIFAQPLIKTLAPGLAQGTAAAASGLLVTMSPLTALMGFWIVAGAYLNTEGEFALPIYVPMALDAVLLTAVLAFGGRFGVPAAAWGFLAGAVVQTAILARALFKRGYRFDVGAVKLKTAASLARAAFPVAVSVALGGSLQLLDKHFASSMAPGVISCLHYAVLVTNIPIGVFGVALATVAFPELAGLLASGKPGEAKRSANRALAASLTVGAACGAVLASCANIAVKLLFGYGGFDAEAVSVTSDIVRWQSVAIPALTVGAVMERVFYAHGKTGWPLVAMAAGVASFVGALSIPHDFVGLPPHSMLGLGYSSYACVYLMVLSLRYRRLERV